MVPRWLPISRASFLHFYALGKGKSLLIDFTGKKKEVPQRLCPQISLALARLCAYL